MIEPQGTYTIPARLFLSAEQRAKLEQIVRSERSDLSEVVSQILTHYLDTLPVPAPVPAPAPDRRDLIRQRRAELGRLRARAAAAGSQAPAWKSSYIADLEAELRRLER